MKNNINKLVAFAIGLSVMSVSIIPAFAEAVNQSTNANAAVNQSLDEIPNQSINNYTYGKSSVSQKSLLTLKGAIDSAVSTSETLALDDKKITYQDKMNDLNEEKDDASNTDDDKKDFDKDTNDNTLDALKQQKDFDTDKLVQQITIAYNNIVTSQMKIDKASKVIDINTKELNDAKLKENLSIYTSIDVKSTELQIQNLQNQ